MPRKTDPMSRQLHRGGISEDGWVESMVEVARMCNKLWTKHTCDLCHVYVDKQVEFENRQERQGSSLSPVDRAWMKTGIDPSNLEVSMYRQFLFDEESVISGASHRDDDQHMEHHRRPKPCGSKDHDEEQSVATHGSR